MNLYRIPRHKKSPEIVNAVIEIPKNTGAKYEYDPKIKQFRLDRCLPSSMKYPASYGFIPSTMAEDGDALDVMVLCHTPIDRATVVKSRVLGALDMEDDKGQDWKIIACPVHHEKRYEDLEDIDPMILKVIANFFSVYKMLRGKEVRVGDWYNKNTAYNIISDCETKYYSGQRKPI